MNGDDLVLTELPGPYENWFSTRSSMKEILSDRAEVAKNRQSVLPRISSVFASRGQHLFYLASSE